MRRGWAALRAVLVLVAACTSSSRAPVPAPAIPDVRQPPTRPPAIPSGAVAAPDTRTRWAGTYNSAAAPFYVPDGGEWANYSWRGGDGGDGVGDGRLELVLDGVSGRVEGSAGGAIGDVLLVGVASDTEITASVRRKDPGDHGLTGTLVATRGGASAESIAGTMRLSFGDAHILREATFTLTRSRD